MWWNEQHCGLECGDPLRGHCWNRQDGERHWQVCPGPLCGWNCGATSDTEHSLYAHQHLPFRPCWQVSPPAVTALILAFRCTDCKLRQTMSPVSGHFKSVKGIQISIKNKIKLTCDRTSVYECVCVCVCARACVCVCVCVWNALLADCFNV